MILLSELPFILLMVLASSTSSDRNFFVLVRLCRPKPHQDLGQAGPARNHLACDDKELGPQLGELFTRWAVS